MEGNRWRLAASHEYPAGFEIRRPVKSFWLTVYEVLVSPRAFYSRLEAGRSEYPAMAFLYGRPFDPAAPAWRAAAELGVRYALSNTGVERIA